MLEELSDFTIGNHSNYGELLITKTNVKTKGDLIGVVDGVIGEYPDNGIQGKYYYEKVK